MDQWGSMPMNNYPVALIAGVSIFSKGTILSPTLRSIDDDIYVFGGFDGYKTNGLKLRYKVTRALNSEWIRLDDGPFGSYPLIVPYTNKIIEK